MAERKITRIRPQCDIEGCTEEASYDACLIIGGGWAYLCKKHYKQCGSKIKGLFTDLDALEKRKTNV